MARSALLIGVVLLSGCNREFEGGGDLRAQRVVLNREVTGLRDVVERLERGDSLLSATEVVVAIDEAFVRDIVRAQLPLDYDVDRYHLELTDADLQLRGSPIVRLRGHIVHRDRPTLTADVVVIGALDELRVDDATSVLQTRVAVDHITIERATGLTDFLDGATVDEVARSVRLQVRDRLPTFHIPVRLQRELELPGLTDGPVRFPASHIPLSAAVSQVVAARGRLWITVRVTPGTFTVASAPARSERAK